MTDLNRKLQRLSRTIAAAALVTQFTHQLNFMSGLWPSAVTLALGEG